MCGAGEGGGQCELRGRPAKMDLKSSGADKALRRERREAKEGGATAPKARPGPSAVSSRVREKRRICEVKGEEEVQTTGM